MHASNLKGALCEIPLTFSFSVAHAKWNQNMGREKRQEARRTTLDEAERYCMGKKGNHRERDQDKNTKRAGDSEKHKQGK